MNRPPDWVLRPNATPHYIRSNVWPAPTGTRFVKIYGGELDGLFHPADGWYSDCTLNGYLRYLEWMEPQ